jgi:hypothetical protein
MITVVLWKWGDLYLPYHVERMVQMIRRNLHIPHKIVCITDDTGSIPGSISAIPIRDISGKRHCRRLWIFSDEARYLGSTLLQIDLDMIITDDLTPLVQSFYGYDFKVWKCKMSSRYRFGLNPSFMMLNTNVPDHHDIWTEYKHNPEYRLTMANRDGWPASDQAIISHHFTRIVDQTHADPTCPVWTANDGIISMRDELRDVSMHPKNHIHTPLPPHTRLVSFHGRFDPKQFIMLDWVKQHWLGESIP